MLRVGLTGGLGSGKSTVAGIFAELGAFVIAADEIGRRLMQPGEAVYSAIVSQFGKEVVRSDGSLDRRKLAELSFQQDRAQALNLIVHPATVAAEKAWLQQLFQEDPSAIAIVESALIFEVEEWGTAPGWLDCFDKMILVTAPDEVRIERFVNRVLSASPDPGNAARKSALEQDARARLKAQIPDQQKISSCDYVVVNEGSIEDLRGSVRAIYGELQAINREPGI
jgi:dephospho-CoA kinase